MHYGRHCEEPKATKQSRAAASQPSRLLRSARNDRLCRQRKRIAAMTDSDAVLAANLEFYRAFTARDLAAMDALWARAAPVACIHPGWPALSDRDAIMESWRSILGNPGSPRIACYDERVL